MKEKMTSTSSGRNFNPHFYQPENPSDPIYHKICFVCQEAAKPGTDHLRNYGGIVCYSCRAFWRRCHQRTKTPSYRLQFDLFMEFFQLS